MKTRIYVVDDEEVIREVIFTALQGELYQITVFPNAQLALEAIQGEPPEILISDIMLPGMNGFELAEEVLARFQGVSVILITGYSSQEKIMDALRLGVHEFLPKPFTINELEESLKRVLGKRGVEKENIRLRGLLSFKKVLLGRLNHQLIEPLTRIRGYLEIADLKSKGLTDGGEVASFIQKSLGNLGILQGSLKDLLDFSHLKEVPLSFEEAHTPLNLTETLNRELTELKNRLKEKNSEDFPFPEFQVQPMAELWHLPPLNFSLMVHCFIESYILPLLPEKVIVSGSLKKGGELFFSLEGCQNGPKKSDPNGGPPTGSELKREITNSLLNRLDFVPKTLKGKGEKGWVVQLKKAGIGKKAV